MKNLFIIIGTSKGLGKALLEVVMQNKNNYLIIVNRRKTNQGQNNAVEQQIDLSKIISRKQLNGLFACINSLLKKHALSAVNLINNASVIEPIMPIGQVSRDELTSAVNVNYLNYLILLNHLINFIRKSSRTLRIINITSGAAVSPHAGLGAYCSTKAALEMLGQCINLEQAKNKQIKIINLRPGVMNTTMQQKMCSSQEKNFPKAAIYKKIFKDQKLLDTKLVAQKIYQVFGHNKYWRQSILDVNDIK